jgi:peptidoglycan/xylan/chitin deacetylase (PgdA/CDA1 family)
MLDELWRIVSRKYPACVYGDAAALARPDYVPIFTFHSFTAADLESKLSYLAENGYRTIDVDELVRWMRGQAEVPPRSVAITIDDGRLSTWTVAYPLLKKYGMRATTYIIPGYTLEGQVRPTLEDVWSGRCEPARVQAADEAADAGTFVNWSEVEAMQGSGVMRIESHTMLHRRVSVAAELVGFVLPPWGSRVYDLPLRAEDRGCWTEALHRARWGEPIWKHIPLLTAIVGVEPPESVRSACRAAAAEIGQAGLSTSRGQAALRAAYDQAMTGVQVQPVELREVRGWEFSQSRAAIGQRLGIEPARHFCYPNSVGDAASVEQAAAAGYVSCAWNVLPGRGANRRGADPSYLERIKHDFIWSLPGRGRRGLLGQVTAKVRRRLSGATGF